MSKNKRCLHFLAAAMTLMVLLVPSFSALADSPAPPSYFYSTVTGADSAVKYTDILIKIDKSSQYYAELNPSCSGKYGFTASTPIVAYDQDGYRSASFHIKGTSGMGTSNQGSDLFGGIELESSGMSISKVTDSVKIALLDKDGNILKVSEAVSVTPTEKDTFPRKIEFNVSDAAPTVTFSGYYHGHLFAAIDFSLIALVAFLIRMVISVTMETLIAVPFKIRPLWKIIVVNIITQLLLFAFIEFGLLSYTLTVVIGEVLVYVAEFIAYLFLFKPVSKPKLALYTVVANTASLAVGLIFNAFHILIG